MSRGETIVIAPILIILLLAAVIPYIALTVTAFTVSSGGNPDISLTQTGTQAGSFTGWGWANVSSTQPQGDTISFVEYNYPGISNVTLAANTGQRDVQFYFSYVVNFCFQAGVEVLARDSLGNWNSLIYPQPCPAGQTFTNSTNLTNTVLGGCQ